MWKDLVREEAEGFAAALAAHFVPGPKIPVPGRAARPKPTRSKVAQDGSRASQPRAAVADLHLRTSSTALRSSHSLSWCSSLLALWCSPNLSNLCSTCTTLRTHNLFH